ncbi:MAG: carboxypeptidase-like regulatory domain-containing protein [Gemmatimonadales bacterium]
MSVRKSLLFALLALTAACADPLSVDGFQRVPIPDKGTGSLGGTVTQPDIEGNPVPFPGRTIYLTSSPGMGAAAIIMAQTMTDSTGSWEFSGLVAGAYGLVVFAPPSPTFDGTDMYGIEVKVGFKTIVNVAAGRPSTP